jgi:TolA-binding protein
MAISDYLNGPKYRLRVQDLESQLADLQKRYDEMQDLAKKYGAMDVLEIQSHIGQEHGNLEAVRLATRSAERDVAALAHQTTELRAQILVFEETVLLESFALYEPKFKLNTSHEYKTRLDSVRERQKVMIKNGEAATGNMG